MSLPSGNKRRPKSSGSLSAGGRGTLIQDRMLREGPEPVSQREEPRAEQETAVWLVETMAVTIMWDLCNMCFLFT